MSSFKNALKSNQHVHRERSQPAARAHLGVLEKKKDYKVRAEDYQRKQNTIKVLKRKALDKNPDEFYFKMVRTRLEEGVHKSEDPTPTYTPEQLSLMNTRDIKYVRHKRNIELKKIEKLKSTLHLLDVPDKPKNKHIVFVDSKKEAATFDAATYFDTHPALVDRSYNRLKTAQLKTQGLATKATPETLQEVSLARSKAYKELTKRIEREKQLQIIEEKMTAKQHLMDRKARKKKMADETKESAAIYQWMPQRKR